VTSIPECEAYEAAAKRYIKCEKVPQESRDAAQTSLDNVKKNWGDIAGMNEETRKAVTEGCQSLGKAMKDLYDAAGCDLQ
jgi:hypothetical protein